MKRLIGLSAAGVATLAVASVSFTKVFHDAYKIPKGSTLGKANCMACHTSMKGALNGYGKDIGAAMKAANSKKLTADILKKVENLDSNKNGVKNIDEIKADKNPGK